MKIDLNVKIEKGENYSTIFFHKYDFFHDVSKGAMLEIRSALYPILLQMEL